MCQGIFNDKRQKSRRHVFMSSKPKKWYVILYVQTHFFRPNFGLCQKLMSHRIPRTQNIVEAWHRRWPTLVGKAHIGVYAMIEKFKKEQQRVDLKIENINRGEPQSIQKRQIIDSEKIIMTVYKDRTNRSILDFLRSLAHCISM